MTIPAHKVVGDENKPGQIKTLGDYVKVVEGFEYPFPAKKLSFEEWAENSQLPYRSVETKQDLWDYLQMAWKAAQENV